MFSYALVVVCVCPAGWATKLPAKLPALGGTARQFYENLEFGNSQYQQFVADRGDTRPLLQANSELRWMLIWQFAGGLTGQRIYWNKRPQRVDFGGHYPSPYGDSSVTVGRDASAIDKCAILLFQLLNCKVDAEYNLLLESTPDKRKSQRDFAESCVRKEFNASKALQSFFLQHPMAGAEARRDPYYCNTVSFQYGLAAYDQFAAVQYSNRYNPTAFYDQVYRYLMRNQNALRDIQKRHRR